MAKTTFLRPNGMEQTRESALDHQEKKKLYKSLV